MKNNDNSNEFIKFSKKKIYTYIYIYIYIHIYIIVFDDMFVKMFFLKALQLPLCWKKLKIEILLKYATKFYFVILKDIRLNRLIYCIIYHSDNELKKEPCPYSVVNTTLLLSNLLQFRKNLI